MLNIDIALQEKDFINFSSFTQLLSPEKRKKSQKAFAIRMVVLGVILGVYVLASSSSGDYTSVIIYAAVLVVLTVIGRVSRKSVFEKSLKAMYEQPENDSLFERKEYTFSETGISITARYSFTQFKWEAIVKKIEMEGYIFLYTSAINALVLPLRYFNDWQKDELYKLLSQHLSFRADVGHAIAE